MRTSSLARIALVALALASGALPAGAAPGDDSAPPAAAAEKKDPLLEVYDRGLDFLLTLAKDGAWESKPGEQSVEFTAIAASCLYGRPGGVREKDRAVAGRAIDVLVAHVKDDGFMTGVRSQNYAISVTLQALVASRREGSRPLIDKFVAVLKSCQVLDRADPNFGGIGYVPGVGPPRPPRAPAPGAPAPAPDAAAAKPASHADLSNTVYALSSLRAAGVKPDDPVFKNAIVHLQRVQNRKENETPGEPTEWKDAEGRTVVRSNDGGAVYGFGKSPAGFDERPDGVRVLRSYGSMTYALLGCYHMAGLPADDGRVKAAADWISKNFAVDRNPGMPEESKTVALFYSYDAMASALTLARIDTIRKDGVDIDWRKALLEQLAKTQHPDGSWSNDQSKYMEGIPVVATSLALLSLSGAARR